MKPLAPAPKGRTVRKPAEEAPVVVELGTFETDAEVDRSPAKADSVPSSHAKLAQDIRSMGVKPEGKRGADHRLTQDQLDFVEWLCTPIELRDPPTQNGWERTHGYNPGTCARWKNQNVGFRAVLQDRFDTENRSPERVQEVINALFKAGITKLDSKALMDYLRLVGAYTDRSQIIQAAERPSDMTNQELIAELTEELAILTAKEQLA